MQQEDVNRSQEFRKCIECFLCQNVCHVNRDHEENKKSFAGPPRYLMRQAELSMHPLDTLDRRDMAQEEKNGLGFCNITKCCTEVCPPEHIKITDNALIPMKERVADKKYDRSCGWATSCSGASSSLCASRRKRRHAACSGGAFTSARH